MSAKLKISDDSTNPPLNVTARSSAPSSPATNDQYFDDGTNTASTKPGWRRWNGSAWIDLGTAAATATNFGAGVTKTLASDKTAAGSDRHLVLSAESGTSDNLIELTGLSVGDEVIIRAASGHTITVKHNDSGATDKIILYNGADLALSGDKTLKLCKTAAGKVVQYVDATGGSSGPSGQLGYTAITSAFSTNSDTAVDITGLIVTVPVGTRPIKITIYLPLVDMTSGTNTRAEIDLVESTTVLQAAYSFSASTSQGNAITLTARLAPSAGSHTYKAQMLTGVGSGTMRAFAAATIPAFILVEEL